MKKNRLLLSLSVSAILLSLSTLLLSGWTAFTPARSVRPPLHSVAVVDTAGDPWKENQLLEPAALQQMLTDKTAPLVLSIGPGAMIKGSEDIGPSHETAGLERLRRRLRSLPRNTAVVIYCGCCPFVHCPNIRPAFALLTEMKFTEARLLNIQHNIKTDWISPGYAVNP